MADNSKDNKKDWKLALIKRAEDLLAHGEGELHFIVSRRSKEEKPRWKITGGTIERGEG